MKVNIIAPAIVAVLLSATPIKAASPDKLPVIRVSSDDTLVTTSAILKLPGEPIRDENGDGVIHVRGDNITVKLTGTLSGASADLDPDQYTGKGITIEGKNVTIRQGAVTGFRVAVYARNCPGLVVEDMDLSGNFRQHLRSNRYREDSSDWLWPHDNRNELWISRYGAALCVAESDHVTIRNVRVRRGQNGIILDRVNKSEVYDCDCSFLSGWGLALWRSNKNIISRNAFDFCIRGYSQGYYNRGQDSAGILMFEQCSDNIIAENSATHCGDGFFGFAGKDALGEYWLDDERDRLRKETGRSDVDDLIEYPEKLLQQYRERGNNHNLVINNDFSYAAAHGIEMTFSFHNRFLGNKLVKDAICGIWGGYDQQTLIAGNTFKFDGELGYGLERGGVNIEHGYGNRIQYNKFNSNKCGIHLWWDEDAGMAKLPWIHANEKGSSRNMIVRNTFDEDDLAIHLRRSKDTIILGNNMVNVKEEIKAENSNIISDVPVSMEIYSPPDYPAPGNNQPVGARDRLAGRSGIIMTEWGPYDYESPAVIYEGKTIGDDGYPRESCVFLGFPDLLDECRADILRERDSSASRELEFEVTTPFTFNKSQMYRLTIKALSGGVLSESVKLAFENGAEYMVHFSFVAADWKIRAFSYETDPRKDPAAWRAEAEKNGTDAEAHVLDFRFGYAGPARFLNINKELPSDHFGIIAESEIPLNAGEWYIRTLSDDGIRVWVDDKLIIDNWTWHGPTEDHATLTLDKKQTVHFRVEYFELDGNATLSLDISRPGDSETSRIEVIRR